MTAKVFAARLTLLGIFVGMAGCASFLHFSDPGAQAVSCGIAESEATIIVSAASICGPFAPACLAALEAIFGDACTAAATAGKSQEEAHKAGLEAVTKHARDMKARLVRAGVEAKP